MYPVSVVELCNLIKDIIYDIDYNKYGYLSDHRPNGTSIYNKGIHVCDAVTLNVLSKHYICFMSGLTLDGKSCTEPDSNNWKVELKSQYGFENSHLVKISHDERERLISEYVKKLFTTNSKIVIGLQEISDSQCESFMSHLPKNIIIMRTTLKNPGENNLSGAIIFNSDFYSIKRNTDVIKYSENNNNNYIFFATFSNKETKQDFIFVNTHVSYGKASQLVTFLLDRTKIDPTIPVIFVGDTNCACKPQNIGCPTLVENFNENDFGFCVPKYKGVISWTNMNIRKNVMSTDDIDWLWHNYNKDLSDNEKIKRKELINKQCDAFDVVGIVYNQCVIKHDILFKDLDLLIDDFTCTNSKSFPYNDNNTSFFC